MKCPACRKTLKEIVYENEKINICPYCGGMWFDNGKMQRVIDSLLAKNQSDYQQALKESYRDKIIGINKRTQIKRKCPRCSVDMQVFNYSYDSNIFLDKCPKCSGIWTDKGELKAVLRYIKGNEDIANYAKELIKTFGNHQRCSRIKTVSGIAAILIALLYLAIAVLFEGTEEFLKVLLFLILPLICIFRGEELGETTGIRFVPTLFSPVVSKPTPGIILVIIGWIWLLLPAVIAIILALTANM